MKQEQKRFRNDFKRACIIFAIAFFGAISAFGHITPQQKHSESDTFDSCRVILLPLPGENTHDKEIARLQKGFSSAFSPSVDVEKLGWLFIDKARRESNPSYYSLAEKAALCLETQYERKEAAFLLRGHVYQNLHRFKEAETLARVLIERRGLPFDYALLGDALMEQGKLDESIDAYQKMIDLKPGLEAYSRTAHIRWLKGDLSGAIEVMEMAARAGDPRNPEPVAWILTRLALYRWQEGDHERARQALEGASELLPDYAPTLFVKGRMLLANKEYSQAATLLRKAVEIAPLPEYQWALLESLRAEGNAQEAEAVESILMQKGASEDARTFSLYLASFGKNSSEAVHLAKQELQVRRDVFTYGALAWALAASGKENEAYEHILLSLKEGTKDARLFYHAGVIAFQLGKIKKSKAWLEKAEGMSDMLMPSEREKMEAVLSVLETEKTAGNISNHS